MNTKTLEWVLGRNISGCNRLKSIWRLYKNYYLNLSKQNKRNINSVVQNFQRNMCFIEICLGWTLEIISTFHNLVALQGPCRVRQFQFWCPRFSLNRRRSVIWRSPAIKMFSPLMFVFPLFMNFCWFVDVSHCWGVMLRCMLFSSFAHARHYLDCHVTGWSTARCL